MLLDRMHISIALEVRKPLAIGTGGRIAVKDDQGEERSILEIHRDAEGAPCIPATSLKGALRSKVSDTGLIQRFFGDISDDDASGVTGRLMIYAAMLDPGASDPKKPVNSRRRSGDHEFDRPATAIDRDTGAVARNKLFTLRAVAPGSVFQVEMTLLGDYPCGKPGADMASLAKVLAPLRDGLRLGKGGRLGGGLLTLHGAPRIVLTRFDPEKGFVTEDRPDLGKQLAESIEAERGAAEGASFASLSFDIVVNEPFFIADPASPHLSQGDTNSVQLAALEDEAGHPVLWPSSLIGVIRSRAAWLAELDRLRAKDRPAAFTPAKRDKTHPADDLDLAHIFGARRAVEKKADVAALSSVERLFGVAGWKGLIQVARLTLDPAAQGHIVKLTGVKIDRLSGGVVDGALFTTRAFAGARFNVRFSVEVFGRDKWVSDGQVLKDIGLLKILAADLEKHGIEIGHAASRGFGWCKVENVKFAGALQ